MRLIDADALKQSMLITTAGTGYQSMVLAEIDNAPTVDAVSRVEAIDVVCDKCPISFKEKCEWRDNGHCSMKVALEALPSALAKEWWK